jgi:hypothetical protein
VQESTRDLVRGLETLAQGGPSEVRGSDSARFRLALGAQDRRELEAQARQLARETRQGAAGGQPPSGWEALSRLSRDVPGYGASGSQDPSRGSLVRAKADLIDLPEVAGVFDSAVAEPRLHTWEDWMLRSPQEMAEVEVESIRSYADPCLQGRAAERGDGLEVLAARMVIAGLVVPTKRAKGVRGVRLMTVAKSRGRQRLVWDMRQANARFRPPPAVKLGSIGALASLELGEQGFFAAAATDIPNFFYALRMPAGFESYVVLEGVDLAYVRRLLRAQGHDCSDWPEGVDALGCRCLPMGFSWAPLLAQAVLEHIVQEAGLAGESELRHGCGQVALRRWATLCYLDDFTVLVKRASAAAARQEAGALLNQVKSALAAAGLGSHKDQAGELLEVLGVVVDASEGQVTLRPNPAKFAELLAGTQEMLRRRSVEARVVQRLLGHWAWWLQLCRPVYSALDTVYPFVLESGSRGRVQLPLSVRREFRMLLRLAPCVRCHLDWPVAPVVHMVDAGPRMGAVVSTSFDPPPEFTAQVEPPPRRKWKLAVQRAWKYEEHNNCLEGRTVLWAVERCARAGLRNRVCVVFTDSLVIKGAFSKGRSSSRSINRLCRRHAALCLAFGLRVVLKYVPSAENWADGPSRGLAYPGVAPETRAKAASPPGRPPGLAPGALSLP